MKTYTLSLVFLAVISFKVESQVVLVAEKADSSAISNLTPSGDKLFFSSWAFGDSIEVWVTDGTLNSSKMIKKLPNFYGIMGAAPLFFFDYNNSLIFQALESYSFDEFWNLTINPYLWKSDGTAEGTIELKKLETWFYLDDAFPYTWGGKYIQLGDKLLFAATAPDTLNYELWTTDGTSKGTTRLLEINNDYITVPYFPANQSSFPSSLTKIGNKMYFSANDAIHGQELWVTDGSASGTYLLKDINPGEAGSLDYYYHEEMFKATNDKLFFTVDFGRQLWVSDGTESGTISINKFNYSVSSTEKGIFIEDLIDVNDMLYFEVNYWNYNILENDSLQIWKSDGTENGTAEVYDISNMEVSSFKSYKSNLYFLNKNSGLHELWKCNGTINGTLKISEFQIPENSTTELYVFNDSIYFAALDANNKLKIWKSDGTVNGTKPVEIWDEPGITSITDMVLFNDGIYFSASHTDFGTGVFKYLNGAHIFTKVLSNASSNKLSISPNPASNFLNIYLADKNQNGIITIYTIAGTKIVSYTVQPGAQMINTDISNLKNGLYFVSFTGNSRTSIAKFIKQ